MIEKNMSLKTFRLKKFCWITDCNKEVFYYRKYDANPRPTCSEHFNKLPEISKRHYFKIKKEKFEKLKIELTKKTKEYLEKYINLLKETVLFKITTTKLLRKTILLKFLLINGLKTNYI